MGVHDLLKMLKTVMEQVHISKYRGKTAGIDAAGWLYKGCYPCAEDVVQGRATDVFLHYCVQQIELLREHGVTPVFVFDGAPLPAKAAENAERLRNRQMSKDKALRLLESGDGTAAYKAFTKAMSVSNEMIMRFIAILRRMDIQFVVAPYEADAQLAYMSRTKAIDVVISEDSDCVPYGCRTILFKWDSDGWASELKRRNLGANEDYSFAGWSEEMFVSLCVLCGCDYCPSIPGVGIVSAYKFVAQHRAPFEILNAVEKAKRSVLPAQYARKFISAIITFRHHLVFDRRDSKLKMLNPLSGSEEFVRFVDQDLGFLGNLELRNDVAAAIASADIHPTTHDSYAWLEIEAKNSAMDEVPKTRSATSSETSGSIEPAIRKEFNSSNRVDSEAGHQEKQIIRSRRTTTQDKRDRSDIEPPKPPSASWGHLDSVLGSSDHILNFCSPKVSENFRPLVSLPTNRPSFRAGRTAEQLKAYEDKPVRQSLKRIRNPQHRNRDQQKSGFDGEVTCRVEASDRLNPRITQRRKAARIDHSSNVSIASSDYGQPTPMDQDVELRHEHVRQSILHAANMHQQDHDNDEESETLWSASMHSGMRPPRPPVFGYSSAARASYAEEKWDRILGSEIDESEAAALDATSATSSSAASFTGADQ